MSQLKSPVAGILNLVKLERQEIISIYFFAILSGLIQLSLPLGVQAIIGFVLGGSYSTSLMVLITLVVAGVLFTGLMQIGQMRIIEKVQQKIFVRYSFAITDRIPQMDLKKADSIYLPELVNRFFDITILQKGLTKLLLDIPTATIQILFGLVLLSFYNPVFILFGLILVAILWLILYYTGNRGLQTSITESTHKYETAAWMEEMARVIKSLKFSRNSGFPIYKTDEKVSAYLHARTSHFRILIHQFFSLVGFKVIITASMLIVGTILLVNQQLNIGQFIASEIVILLVISSVEKLIGNLDNVYDVLTSVEKLSNITERPVEKRGHLVFEPQENGVSLAMKNLSFGYSNNRNVLNNISFEIQAGEKVAITGTDGTGKSTLLKLFSGSYSDFQGSILVNNIPISNYETETLRAHTGILLNQQDIFAGTLMENITMGSRQVSLQQVNELAEKTGLIPFLTSLSNGYDTVLDATGNRLPRNVVHKILLMRALLNKPQMLLLEEPWTGLQEKNKKLVRELLLNNSNTTILVVTHDEEFIRQCDKIIYITENGCEVKTGWNTTPGGGEGF